MDEGVVFENVSNADQSMRIEGRAAFATLAEQAASMFVTRHQAVRTAIVQADRDARCFVLGDRGRQAGPNRRYKLIGGHQRAGDQFVATPIEKGRQALFALPPRFPYPGHLTG
ncbi:hypothetical protein NZL82_06425 [Sphingomonas sanguinis]|uniref:hypothetical protein n=1 Tax=Sphingomonas sp. LC-1 TaxID=3110957 RepID=UPI0021BAAAAA|nr:hypothetical protein [Sphingomonas sp. LC-1]MCT8001514.1 hypothetical protein [Sphingomonas sp. LC-1]